ncbi:MAG: DUF938 domain-containing protein [Croceibacterium sp.]
MKRHAPATDRNRDPIAAVLTEHLPPNGMVLEVAAGTGEHAVHFARCWPWLQWQPTDPDAGALASIAAWRGEAGLPNLLPPLQLDAAASQWPVQAADALVCINMIHISPIGSTLGLFAGAGRILPMGAPLVLYGPYLEADVTTAAGNLAFDADLKARNPEWGLRDLAWVDGVAASHGFSRTHRVAMPANNLTVVYRRD